MPYHVTQELETTISVSSASTPSTACIEALHTVDRELSVLKDDPRVYNYDLFNATVTHTPTHETEPFTVVVAFTVTAAVYTDSRPTATTTGTTTIQDAIAGLFDTQTPVGDAATQDAT